jgi:hypothetical protein
MREIQFPVLESKAGSTVLSHTALCNTRTAYSRLFQSMTYMTHILLHFVV